MLTGQAGITSCIPSYKLTGRGMDPLALLKQKGIQGVLGICFALDEAVNTEASVQSCEFLRTTLFILRLFFDVRQRL